MQQTSTQLISLPAVCAWRLHGAYEGFEVTHFATTDNGTVLTGTSVGIEANVPWAIHYTIEVDSAWHIRHALIDNAEGHKLEVQTDGKGHWKINGVARSEFDGYLDLDLEASAVTNTLPVHRLALAVDQRGSSQAVYIRTKKLAAEKLEQTYRRLPDANKLIVFDYESPRFGYHDRLRFAYDGLIMEYPGIATRASELG